MFIAVQSKPLNWFVRPNNDRTNELLAISLLANQKRSKRTIGLFVFNHQSRKNRLVVNLSDEGKSS